MINGHVTALLEPRIEIFVEDDTGHPYSIEAAIDTGYSGFMALPPAMITTLALPWFTDRPFELADGSKVRLDVYTATVIWDGQPRKIEIHAIGRTALIGVKMLAGHEARMRFFDGGPVWIDVVP